MFVFIFHQDDEEKSEIESKMVEYSNVYSEVDDAFQILKQKNINLKQLNGKRLFLDLIVVESETTDLKARCKKLEVSVESFQSNVASSEKELRHLSSTVESQETKIQAKHEAIEKLETQVCFIIFFIFFWFYWLTP